MAKIQEPVTFVIKHPKLTDVSVTCRELDPMEAMDMYSSFARYQTVIPVLDPATKEYVKGDEGEILTRTVTNLPAEAILTILQTNIESWQGIEDAKGNPIPYTKEHIRHLFNRAFVIPKKTVVKKSGKDTDELVSQSFADYIQQEINERSKKVLADLDKEFTASKK